MTLISQIGTVVAGHPYSHIYMYM